MKTSYLFIFLLITLFSSEKMFSQKASYIIMCEKGSAEYQMRYDKLLAMFEEKHKTEIYKEYITLVKSFDEKANFPGTKREMIINVEKGLNGVHEWVRNNIELTDFKNCEEAEAEIAKINSLKVKIFLQNMDIHSYLSESSGICKGLLIDLMLDLTEKYGSHFEPY